MDQKRIKELLRKVKKAELSVDEAVDRLRHLPFEDIDVACIDHHRSIRKGASEVIYGEGKEVEDILAIMKKMIAQEENILITRLSPEKAEKIRDRHAETEYYLRSRVLMLNTHPYDKSGDYRTNIPGHRSLLGEIPLIPDDHSRFEWITLFRVSCLRPYPFSLGSW